MDVLDFLSQLDDNTIDLVIADPPYNVSIDVWDKFEESEYWDFTYKWLELMIKKLKPNGSFYLFNNAYNSALIVNYLKDFDVSFQNWIVWYKKDGFSPAKRKYVNNQETILFYTKGKENKHTFNYNDIRVPYESTSRMAHAAEKGILKNGKRWYPNPDGKLCPDVWQFSSHRHKNKVDGKLVKSIHPTPKPEDMIERMVLASSNPGDLVLDLFSGTGTTSFVAKKNGRKYLACEINSEYIEVIESRLSTLTDLE